MSDEIQLNAIWSGTQEIYEIDPRLASEATFKAKISEILYHRCLTFLETMGIVCKRIVSVRGHSRLPKESLDTFWL